MEVDGGGIAGPHLAKLVAFAKGVGAGEIDAQVIAKHEADVGVENGFGGAGADAEDDFGGGFEEVEGTAIGVGDLDADNLRAGIAVAVVDVGDAGDEFGGLRGGGGLGRCVFGAGEAEELGVLFDHVGQVFGDDQFGFAEFADVAVIEPHGAVADGFDVADGVGDEEDGHAFGAEFMHLSHAALAEVDVADGECFVDEEDLRVDVDGDGEGEADGHAAGVGFDGLIDEVADFSEGFDFGVAGVDLGGAEAEDGGVEIDVLATGEFGVEAGAQFEQCSDASVGLRGSRRGLQDSRDDLQEGTFTGAVFSDYAEGFAAVYFEGNVAEGPEIAVVGDAIEGEEFFEAVAGSIVDWIALGDCGELYNRGCR